MNKLLENISVTDLPALPHVLVELMEACYGVDVTYEMLAAKVQNDPALSAQVLALVGARGLLAAEPMSSFAALLAKLGRHTIKALAVTNAARQTGQIPDDESLGALIRFWKHSIRCALTARQLATLTAYASPDEAYLAGLLHNIGQLALASRYPQQFASLKHTAQLDTQQLLLEQEQFGVGHTDLGAELIESWGLNSFMADAARFHHQPLGYVLDAHPLVKIVFLADKLSHGESGPVEMAFDAADKLFGLGQGAVAELMSEAGEARSELGQSLELRSGRSGDSDARPPGVAAPSGKPAELASRIEHIALLDSLRPRGDGSEEENALLMDLQGSAQLLTGCSHSACFLYASETNTLQGSDSFRAGDLIADLSIQLEAGRSLITQSLLEERVLHSLSDDSPALTVIDRQILGCLRSRGLLSLPLRQGEHRVGALVIGVDPGQIERLLSQQDLLEAMAADAASELLRLRTVRRNAAAAQSPGAATARTREIVHEVNNPLSSVRNYLQVLGMKLGGDHPAQKDLKIMQEELVRVTELMQQFTDQGQRELIQEPVAINSLIADVVRLAGESLLRQGQITTELDLDQKLPPVLSNAGALKQILINLIHNAGEALDRRGRVTIRSRDWFQVDATPFVEIEVVDNGPGIPLELQENIFQPVRSTKGDGHAGLGLSIVKNLVEELGGSIGFRSSAELGTSFRVLLPRVLAERRSSADHKERL